MTEDVFNEGASMYIDDKYHYIIMERGRMYQHYESTALEDILYPLCKNITSSLAQGFEVKHRKKEEDFRKLMWEKQLEFQITIYRHMAGHNNIYYGYTLGLHPPLIQKAILISVCSWSE